MHTRLMFSKVVGITVVAASLLAGSAAHAALFSGPFAPANWTPDSGNDPGATITWLPNMGAATILAITNTSASGSFTTATTVDGSLITMPGTLSFRYTFGAGASDTALAAFGYNGGIMNLTLFPPTASDSGTVSVNLTPGQDVSFILSSDNPAGKKSPPFLLVDDWVWTPVPEPSVVATSALVSLAVAGYSLRRRMVRR